MLTSHLSNLRFRVRSKLEGASPVVFSVFAIFAAFSTYFSMYAFRKPFAAGEYLDVAPVSLFGLEIGYKTILIISQVMGYCTSKFIGIKVISEISGDFFHRHSCTQELIELDPRTTHETLQRDREE